VILPYRSHYRDVLEIIAPVSLRRALHLKDGERLAVKVLGP
jgi:CTP-dependent riboflavin kinase